MEIKYRTNIGTLLSSGTYGSVLYIDTNKKLAEDNSNLFFDDVNKRLGVGLNSPTATIEAFGDLKVGNAGAGNYAAVSQSGDLQLFGTADYLIANDRYAFRSQLNELIGLYFNGTSGRFEFLNNTGGVISWLNVSSSYAYFSNRVGIKVETPASDLQVNGSAVFGNDAIDYVIVYSNGDLSLIGDADYRVQDDKYAFKSFSADAIGLLFDNTNSRFGFTTSAGTDAFIKADGTGDGYFKGKLGLGTATPAEKLEVSGNIMTSSDNNKYYAGAGKDMSIYYDGTHAWINSHEVGSGNLNIGDSTNRIEIESDGDVNFVGGSGLQLGEIYFMDVTGYDTVLAAQDEWYQILGFDTLGVVNGSVTVDHTNDHIIAGKAGIYRIHFSASSRSAAANTYHYMIRTNNGSTPIDNIMAHRVTSVANRIAPVSCTGYADLLANDTVELWIMRIDGGGVSKTITHEHLTLSIEQVAG